MKSRSPRNKTISLSKDEIELFSKRLINLKQKISVSSIIGRTIHQNLFDVLEYLPDKFVDLLFIDPPYYLS